MNEWFAIRPFFSNVRNFSVHTIALIQQYFVQESCSQKISAIAFKSIQIFYSYTAYLSSSNINLNKFSYDSFILAEWIKGTDGDLLPLWESTAFS